MVVIQGATLAGMAAAARLARLGHRVTLHTCGEPLGERWAPQLDALPPVIVLPATWRDLFKKTGRALDPELARAGLRLIEAPPVLHRFDDGSQLALPTERGAQFHALAARYGPAAAARWRGLLDEAGQVWGAAHGHGVEGTRRPEGRKALRALWLDRSLAQAAGHVAEPHLERILLDLRFPAGTSSAKAPALLVTRLAIERTFGRWQLVDELGVPQSSSRLVTLLARRLLDRGVEIVDEPAERPDLDCRPHRPASPWWRASTPSAEAPQIRSLHEPARQHQPGEGIEQEIDHTTPRVRISWRRPAVDGATTTVWDYRSTRRDPSWGLASRRAGDVLARPPIDDGSGTLRASACSPAGPEPWAELASAALAVYELHEHLTGEDCRPTNREFRLPSLRSRRRADGTAAEVVD